LIDENGARQIPIRDIQIACARYYGVSLADMLSARRTAVVVLPRQVAYYLAKMLTAKSLPEIGRRFGGRDHTTALSGIRKIERLRKTNPQLEHEMKTIAKSLGGSFE
jgi:chromosomal replication initiator protein